VSVLELARRYSRHGRDFHKVPLPLLRKEEMRELIVEMRLRHSDERRVLLAMLTPEQSLAYLTRDQGEA